MKLFSNFFPKKQPNSSSPNIELEIDKDKQLKTETNLLENTGTSLQKDCQTVLSNIIDEELELIYLALRIFHKKYRFTAGEANNISANDLVLLSLRQVMDGFYTALFDAERTLKKTKKLLNDYHLSPPFERPITYLETENRRDQLIETIKDANEKLLALRKKVAEVERRIDYEFPHNIIDTVLNTIYKLGKSEGDLHLKPEADDLDEKYKEYNEHINIIAPIIEEFKHLRGEGVKEEAIKTFHVTSLGKIGEWTNKIVNAVHDAREEGWRGLHLEDPQYFLKNTGEDCRVAIVLTEVLDDIKIESVGPDNMKDDDECVTDDSVYDIQFALFKLNRCRLYDKKNIKSRLYKKSCGFHSKSCGHKVITSAIVTLEKNVTYTLIPYTFDGNELGNFKIDIYLNTEHDSAQNITLEEAPKEPNRLTACKMKYYLRYGGKKRTLKKKDKHKKTKNKRNRDKRNRNKRSKRKKVN